MRLDTSQFQNTKAVHEYLSKHSDKVIYSKKSNRKNADEVSCFLPTSSYNSEEVVKSNKPIENPPGILEVKAVINTTNLYDSHQDVHIDNLWKKSLKENKYIEHLREHKSGFENVIADGANLKAYTEMMSFKDLRFKYEGETQALLFDSNVDIKRNAFMHEHYAAGWVKQHSVGMYYVQVLTAIDSKDYPAEYKIWKKYIERIGNKADIQDGFFFPVLEAKVIEGSAVTKGSNHVTPTLNNNGPGKAPPVTEPPQSTQPSKSYFIL